MSKNTASGCGFKYLLGIGSNLWIIHALGRLDGEGDRVAVVHHLLNSGSVVVVLEHLSQIVERLGFCLTGYGTSKIKVSGPDLWRDINR
jgi:hypothetical protein